MPMPLEGRVALVTGAASGIGRATARALHAAGASIAAVDRAPQGLDELVIAVGDGVQAFPADLTDPAAISAVVAAVLDAFGRIDILVNCAGISGVAGESQGALDFSDDGFEAVIDINLRAPFLLTRAVGKHRVDRGGGGRIVNVSSSAAFQAAGVPAVYAASKAGLNALTRVAAADLAPFAINVNAVAPGITKTPMIGLGLSDDDYDQLASAGRLENLSHQAAEPEDVANVIVFLCSEASRQMTAQVLHTSGGLIV